MDFNSGAPILKTCSINSVNSASTISDKNGNLLFYGDSDSVWNKNHSVIPNSGNLFVAGANQFINFLPFPCNDSLFYIIHSGVAPSNTSILNIYYSVINIHANGGLGAITIQNVIIDSNIIIATAMARHANNKDYWIVYQMSDTNIYHARQISSSGIGPVVVSQGGSNKYYDRGLIKLSPHASHFVNCNTIGNTIDYFDFDNNSGLLPNW
ncbi:MAG: hypothetical protein ACJAWO_001281 [Halieaceae bacterium]|jgi:hypothetical protein